jgi:hypothetical protein
MNHEKSNYSIVTTQVEIDGLYWAENKILAPRKKSLFDKNGKIQIEPFDSDKIKLNPNRVREIGEYNDSLSEAEKVTQAILNLRFTI